MTRIVCLRVPDFPLAARLRGEPDLAGETVVVVEGQGATAQVVAATSRARLAGIEAGMTLAQSRVRVSGLVARGRDAASERAACEALGDVAESLSPRVEDAGEGVVYLDGDGLDRRHPTETALAHAARVAARAVGLVTRVGVASNKLVASAATRVELESEAGEADDILIVPSGDEAAFLAPLDVALLDPAPEVAQALASWGVGTLGELARLDPAQVASRLGRAGRDLCAAAHGIDPRPLVPRARPAAFHEGMELEWPLVTIEPFLFIARAALDRLTIRLAARGLAAARLTLELTLDPHGRDVRTVELPAPTREAKTLLELTRLSLEERTPGAPVAGFAFVADLVAPRRSQATLFGPPEPSLEKLATAVARLGARLGAERVGSPRTVDGHVPERFERVPHVLPPEPAGTKSGRRKPARASGDVARGLVPRQPISRNYGLLAVRVLRPPVLLDVIVEAPPLLRPVSIQGPAHASSPPVQHIQGAVRVASGPWSLEEGWWGAAPVTRAYWDVELTNGDLVRIFRDCRTNTWFADGVYD